MITSTKKLRNDANFLKHIAIQLDDEAMRNAASELTMLSYEYDGLIEQLEDALDNKRRLIKEAQRHPEYDTWYEGWCDGMSSND